MKLCRLHCILSNAFDSPVYYRGPTDFAKKTATLINRIYQAHTHLYTHTNQIPLK